MSIVTDISNRTSGLTITHKEQEALIMVNQLFDSRKLVFELGNDMAKAQVCPNFSDGFQGTFHGHSKRFDELSSAIGWVVDQLKEHWAKKIDQIDRFETESNISLLALGFERETTFFPIDE